MGIENCKNTDDLDKYLEQNDPDIAIWKHHVEVCEKALIDRGVSREVIDGLEIWMTDELGGMSWRSTRGSFSTSLAVEAGIVLRGKWLISNKGSISPAALQNHIHELYDLIRHFTGIEQIKKLIDKVNAFDKGRAVAQKKGAEAQKSHAAETLRIIEEINSYLLKDPVKARWTVADRADFIARKLSEMMPPRVQVNGKPYATSTILKKIQGKGVTS